MELSKSIDPAVRQVFDTILTAMGTNYSQCMTSTTISGSGVNQSINLVAVDGAQSNYGEFVPGIRVSVNPPTASLGPSESTQFTAVATNPDGSLVATPVYTWSLIPPAAIGTIDATGMYTAPATIVTGSAADQVKCVLVGSMAYAIAGVNLHP